MEHENTPSTTHARYYLLKINAAGLSKSKYIISSNSERALVITSLQDSLGARHSYGLDEKLNINSLAVHIDLLSFSITREHIMLLVFSISKASLNKLGELIMSDLTDFQNQEAVRSINGIKLKMSMEEIEGPYVALEMSCRLHAYHSDWEYDRYSSVGFYIHGRRGDWMRLWRLSRLYQNSVDQYYDLLAATVQYNKELRHA